MSYFAKIGHLIAREKNEIGYHLAKLLTEFLLTHGVDTSVCLSVYLSVPRPARLFRLRQGRYILVLIVWCHVIEKNHCAYHRRARRSRSPIMHDGLRKLLHPTMTERE